jgi:hypothetical protein
LKIIQYYMRTVGFKKNNEYLLIKV